MDKKKVEKLIEKTIRFTKVTDDDYIQGNVKSYIINTLQVVLKEISKSDWVSVEDGLPEYGESVLVTNKDAPEIVLKTSRTKCKGWNTDKNGFLCAVAFNITHWKPIEKLEE